MANSRSALKRVRQAEKRRETNKKVRSKIRTYTNKFDDAVAAGEAEAAGAAYRQIAGILDRAATKNVIPKKRADRKKGRMAKRLAAI